MATVLGPYSLDGTPEIPQRAGIYAITNPKQKRVFVGSTANLRTRFNDHRRWFRDMWRGIAREAQNGRIKSSLYCADAASYPPGDFMFEVIDMSPELEDEKARLVRENELMVSHPQQAGLETYNGQRAG